MNPSAVTATTAAPNPLQMDMNNPQNAMATPPVPAGPSTTIKFEEDAFDFGNVKQHSTNEHIFKFKNTGSEPLVISNAVGSCGCTVPLFTKDPIAPGATGEIKVEYKPGTQKGNQTKTVTVTANTDPPQTRVNITAFVQEVPGGDAEAHQ
ncbi:MAG: DUF1573 domain-containing protein [Flavobacteriales bacterium]|nr:DUF1573 domain-containing protein [Flavobacteriales bacterium]